MTPASRSAAAAVLERVEPFNPASEQFVTEVNGLKRTPHGHRSEGLRAVTDLLFTFLASSGLLALAGVLHLEAPVFTGNWDTRTYAILVFVYPALIVLCCREQRLYRRFPNVGIIEDTHALFRAIGLATLLLVAVLSTSEVQPLSFIFSTEMFAINFIALLGWRAIARPLYGRQVALGKAGTNVLIIGAERQGRALAEYLQTNCYLGYVVKGFLQEQRSLDPRVLGRISDLPKIAREQYVDEVFVTTPANDELTTRTILTARKFCLDVTVVPELFDGFGFQAPLEYVGEFPVMELHREPIPTAGLVIKRIIDVFLGSLALIAAIPVLFVLAILIYVDSPGPIFYKSQRVGKKGRIFGFYKMRSMVTNAESLQQELAAFNERDGLLFKMEKDPRVTRMGRFLRKYSLDELPQIWNVLKGDMSLVGPRPPLVAEYQKYRLEHKRRLDVVPGITGLWQVSNRHDPSFEAYLAQDLKYIENWNLVLDIEILVRTVPAVLRGTGY